MVDKDQTKNFKILLPVLGKSQRNIATAKTTIKVKITDIFTFLLSHIH